MENIIALILTVLLWGCCSIGTAGLCLIYFASLSDTQLRENQDVYLDHAQKKLDIIRIFF
jgi:hypothetical protein